MKEKRERKGGRGKKKEAELSLSWERACLAHTKPWVPTQHHKNWMLSTGKVGTSSRPASVQV